MESGDAEKLLEFSWLDALCWNAWSPPQHHGICSALPDDAPQLSSRKLALTPCFTWQIPQSIITKANKTPLIVICRYLNYTWGCICNYPLNLQDNACFIKKESENESRSVLSNSLLLHGLHSPWSSPGQNTGVGIRSLLQGIFPSQRSNPGLLPCRQILYQLSHQGSPFKKEKEKGKCINPKS